MADADEWVPVNQPDAGKSSGPSGANGNDTWTPIDSSAEAQMAARVSQYAPEAAKEVKNTSLLQSMVPTLGDIPVVGPMAERGIAKWESTGTSDQDKYGTAPEERYANILAEKQAYRQQRDIQHPYASWVPSIAGGVAAAVPVALAAPFLPETAAGAAIGSALESSPWLAAAASGAGWGAASTAAETLPGENASDYAKRIATGAAWGVPAGTAGNVIGKGLTGLYKSGSKAVESIFAPEKTAISKMAEGVENAPANAIGSNAIPGLSLDEAQMLSAAGHDVNLTDIRGIAPVAQEAANIRPTDPNLAGLNQDIADRLANQKTNFASAMDNIHQDIFKDANGNGISLDLLRDKTDAKTAADAAMSGFYQAAYSHPNAQSVWDSNFQKILDTQAGTKAVDQATEFMRRASVTDPSIPRMPPGYTPLVKDGNRYVLPSDGSAPSLRFWDYFKRSLNDQYNNLNDPLNPAANAQEKKSIQDMTNYLKNTLVDTVRDPNTGVSSYGQALDTGSRYFGENNAFDAGQNFLKIASGATQTNPVILGRSISKINASPLNGGYSQAEKDAFYKGFLANAQANPVQIARAFADKTGAGAVTQQNLSKVLPIDMLSKIDDASQMMRVAALGKTFTPSQPSKGNGHGIGFLGAAAVGVGEHFAGEYLPNIAHYATDPIKLAAAAGATALYGGKYALGLAQKATANKNAGVLLQMLNSNNPNTIKEIQNAMYRNKNVKDAMTKIEHTFANAYVAANANKTPSPQKKNGILTKDLGGRVPRKSGGKVQSGHQHLVDRLFRLGEQAKKTEKAHTEPLLNLPDETVAKALDVAQRAI